MVGMFDLYYKLGLNLEKYVELMDASAAETNIFQEWALSFNTKALAKI